jgi:hypothetical protein
MHDNAELLFWSNQGSNLSCEHELHLVAGISEVAAGESMLFGFAPYSHAVL